LKITFFGLIGPTCVGSMNHRCGTFEPPLRILPYLGSMQRILPGTDFHLTATQLVQCSDLQRKDASKKMKRATT